VSEREMDEQQRREEAIACTVCGTVNVAGDQYCAECGAPLPLQTTLVDADTPAAPLPVQPELAEPDASRAPRTSEKENAAWIFGAGGGVVGGGLLLLLLAAALLTVGQLDDTGTIVMLSFCAAPLGLLVLLIGIARYITSATRRG
jgi:hypothetical protein